MNGEKFHLDLTGRPLEGYRADDVAVALARLLRIPQERARNLLRGKPSRIKRQFEKEKALHLMDKLIACGRGVKSRQVKPGTMAVSGLKRISNFRKSWNWRSSSRRQRTRGRLQRRVERMLCAANRMRSRSSQLRNGQCRRIMTTGIDPVNLRLPRQPCRKLAVRRHQSSAAGKE